MRLLNRNLFILLLKLFLKLKTEDILNQNLNFANC